MTTKDLLGRVIEIGDSVTHFRGGQHDSIDVGHVTRITRGGNLRLDVVHSTRPGRTGPDRYAQTDRVVLIAPVAVMLDPIEEEGQDA
jgi:hypothetical protein